MFLPNYDLKAPTKLPKIVIMSSYRRISPSTQRIPSKMKSLISNFLIYTSYLNKHIISGSNALCVSYHFLFVNNNNLGRYILPIFNTKTNPPLATKA